MVKRKKGELVTKPIDFSEHINDLQSKLRIANICNELIKAENPFSVKIDDADLLTELSNELKTILYDKINNINGNCSNSNMVIEEENYEPEIPSNQLSQSDVFVVKQFVNRINSKKQENPSLKNNVIKTPPNVPLKNKKEVYFEDGEILILTGNSVFLKEDNERDILQAGAEVSFVSDLGGGKISVIDMNSGEEGVIESLRVKKQV